MVLASPRAVAYVRVSTAEQSESGLGVEAQIQSIRTLALQMNVEIVAVHDDLGVSGGAAIEQRPGLLRAIDDLRGGDVLLASKRDRLARDVVIAALVEKLVQRRGARIVTPDAPDDDSPTAVLMKQILDAFGQFERALIRQRTRSAMSVARSKGRRTGHLPWGKQLGPDGIHLVDHAGELAILGEIRRLRHRGLTLIDICDALTEKGLQNRAGRPFKPSHVAQLLERHGDGITLRSA